VGKYKFFKQHPNMKEFQKEIDNILNKCRPKDKSEVLNIMLRCKLDEFADQLYKIKNINEKLI